jgi:hypothetical protein
VAKVAVNFIHQAINGVTLAAHVFWDQNNLLPNLRKDLLCALPNALQVVCPSLLLLGIGRDVGSPLCQKPLNMHVFMQLTHFNTMLKDCGPLETSIHNLASLAPGNHRQYLPKITSHDNNLAPKKHVLYGRVNNTHNMLEHAVHSLKHMLVGHGCLIPHNEARNPNQGRLWTIQGNIASRGATKAYYENFET